MSDNIGNSNARLEKLLKRIMKEKDPVKYDELCGTLAGSRQTGKFHRRRRQNWQSKTAA
jgi:hypothetical protein